MRLDEGEAWAHLTAIPAGGPGESGPLHIVADGGWRCDEALTAEAETLLHVFTPLHVRKHFVVGQLGQSLDGRIATESGHSHYINGPEDIRRLHRLRALADAVVVGAGTVASDDPQLTVRHVQGENPVRVVLDPDGRLDPSRGVFTDGAAPTLWVRAGSGPAEAGRGGAGPSGTEFSERVVLPASRDGELAPRDILEALARRGLHRVLVEGGGITVSRFLEADALDRLHVSVAPLLIGSGRPSVTLPPVATLDDALRPTTRHFRLGRDVLFDLDLRGRAQGE